MTRRDPFSEIESLLERMGREFEELGGTLDTPGAPPTFPGTREIPVDVIEDDETVTVYADLPGFDDDAIEVELRDDGLAISASRDEATTVSVDESATHTDGESDTDTDESESDVNASEPDTDASERDAAETDGDASDSGGHNTTAAVRYHRQERRKHTVSRRVSLPTPVDREGASASYENGVLTVTLPKATGGSGHHIDVR